MRLSFEIVDGADMDHIEPTILIQAGKIGKQVTLETNASGLHTLEFEDSVGIETLSERVTAL